MPAKSTLPKIRWRRNPKNPKIRNPEPKRQKCQNKECQKNLDPRFLISGVPLFANPNPRFLILVIFIFL